MESLLVERPLSFLRQQRGDLHGGANAIVRRTRSSMAMCHADLVRVQAEWETGVAQLPGRWRSALQEVEVGIHREAARQLQQQEERVSAMKSTLALLGPSATLKRGFSITRREGKAIHDVGELKPGVMVETQLESGTFLSEVKEVQPTPSDSSDTP